MPAPNAPTLSLTKLSSSSFRADITGDAGVTHRLFHRNLATGTVTTAGTRVGDGSITETALTLKSRYLVWVVSDNGQYSLPVTGFISLHGGNSLAGAIRAHYADHPTLLTLAGRLYTGTIPEYDEDGIRVTIPYTHCDFTGTNFSWTFETIYSEKSIVTFTVYTKGAERSEDAVADLRAAFDWCDLPFQDGSLTQRFEPVDQKLEAELVRYDDGSVVYVSTVTYDVWVERYLATSP